MKSRIRTILRILLQPLEWLTAMLLLTMMVLTFLDVLGRYVFSAPIYGAAEMIQFLLAATVFSAMGPVSAKDGHIYVELISPRLEAAFPRLQPFLVMAFTVVGLVLIGGQLARIGLEALQSGKTTIVLEWPIAMIALPSAFFCLSAAVVSFSAREPAHRDGIVDRLCCRHPAELCRGSNWLCHADGWFCRLWP